MVSHCLVDGFRSEHRLQRWITAACAAPDQISVCSAQTTAPIRCAERGLLADDLAFVSLLAMNTICCGFHDGLPSS